MPAAPVQGVTLGHLDEQPARILATSVQKLGFLFSFLFFFSLSNQYTLLPNYRMALGLLN